MVIDFVLTAYRFKFDKCIWLKCGSLPSPTPTQQIMIAHLNNLSISLINRFFSFDHYSYFKQEVNHDYSTVKIPDQVPRDDESIIDAVYYSVDLDGVFRQNRKSDQLIRCVTGLPEYNYKIWSRWHDDVVLQMAVFWNKCWINSIISWPRMGYEFRWIL